MHRPRFVLMLLAALVGSACEPGTVAEGEGEGEGDPVAPCVIGDPIAPAEIELVYRAVDGTVASLIEGGEVPLILPPQGGKVILVGVRARNITCQTQINAGIFDRCASPELIIGREGRPIELVEASSGFGEPIAPDTLQNYANIPVCPTFVSSRDGEGQDYRLEVRLTEAKRLGEASARSHVVNATIIPVCGEPEILEDCRCECDADRNIELSQEEQCPTIHDNDLGAGVCGPP